MVKNIIPIFILKKFGKVEKFWNELLDICHVVFGGGQPSFANGMKHTIRQVEMPALQLEKHLEKVFFFRLDKRL